MGHGSYDFSRRSLRASHDYVGRSAGEIFHQRTINSSMNPQGVQIRESRDSEDHPESLPIILALDETGSMGSVPQHLVKEGFPKIMEKIMSAGIAHPQVLFIGIGDHECDEFPLQVGQFESSDELLDKWLTDIYLEGRGGGNGGESYHLAWYFAGFHTALDSVEKRATKGFLFTIGDEPVLPSLPKSALKNIMGDGDHHEYSAMELLDKAREMYNVYHINIGETGSGSRREVKDGWREIMGDNFIDVDRHQRVSEVIPMIVSSNITRIDTAAEDHADMEL